MARSNHLQLGSSNTHPDEYTRTRLLNRLGLFQQPPTTAAGRRRYPSSAFSGQQIDFSKTTLHPSLVRNGGRAPVLKPAIVTNDNNNTTKDDETDKDVAVENNNTIHNSDHKTSSDSDECSVDKNKDTDSTTVKFNDTVDIVSIPSRHQFSNRIKNVYWSNRYELQENAERNILEYEYEGWDYDKVVLDDEMYVDVNTGALIHPCHLSVDETTGQTVYNTYAAEEEELKAADQISNQKLQQQREEMDQEDDGFEYEDDDSYFRPLQRKSSVASSQ
ncbi:hypothetical protein IV203_027617 [Nitzschia inconspicua]|uniref:Uncharacterized protein n=1 Tax=Nitzschia inconspicua TaxID=303405 RepID=A0A9K3M079_9STRA|nr:hypothetical protein IV203_027617 [Nitzschia inconspicua]